jgi:hypothetical protein
MLVGCLVVSPHGEDGMEKEEEEEEGAAACYKLTS